MAFYRRTGPYQITGIGIVGFHLADNTEFTTGNAGNDLALDDHGRGGDCITGLVIGHLLDPHRLAGVLVQGNQFGVQGTEDHLVAVDGGTAVHHVTAGHDAIGQTGIVLPDFFAGPGIDGIDAGVGGGHVHDAVLDQRLGFLAAHFFAAEGESPGRLQILNVAGVQIFQNAIALSLGTHAIADNVFRGLVIVDDVFVGYRMGPVGNSHGQGAGRNANPELVGSHGCALQVSCFQFS
mmetsp:Transcript_10427/g.26500  ORF Transcript_10427/g.26500 Transcript_10427/m.26500 type:complete len:236 (-) Transcript_10427:31-738(-)